MGTPKALLPDFEGRPFAIRVAQSLFDAGLEEVAIVTGRHHEQVAAIVAAACFQVQPQVVRNVDPDRGQLSSLLVGMHAVCRDGTEAIVVTLVDVPSVTPATIRQVVDAWRRTRAPIVRPLVGGRRGHPVVFDRAVFDELRRTPLDEGARAVVRAHYAAAVDVPVDDRGCLVDVDTPEEYRAMLRGGGDG
jgi:CTP:molybdopterin cytidylyltransferase MocA